MNCVVGSEETCKVTGIEQALGQGSRESWLVGTKSTHRLGSPWSSYFILHLGVFPLLSSQVGLPGAKDGCTL